MLDVQGIPGERSDGSDQPIKDLGGGLELHNKIQGASDP